MIPSNILRRLKINSKRIDLPQPRLRTLVIALLGLSIAGSAGEVWVRHTIDDHSVGADGVKSGDWNQDGFTDWVTGWEQGGVVRIYTHPGKDPQALRSSWPFIAVGNAKAVEDAVLVDLNQDGVLDVVSSTEGGSQTLFVHWAPGVDRESYSDGNNWVTEPIPGSAGMTRWMFAEPAQVDLKHGMDFFAGSKEPDASVGWWKAPANPAQLQDWEFVRIQKAGWIMSLVVEDVDQDGDPDCWVSDRKGQCRGVYWMDNPGPEHCQDPEKWVRHELGGSDCEVMFLDRGDLDGDGNLDTLVATRNQQWIWFREVGRDEQNRPEFSEFRYENPYGMPHGKDIHTVDLNGDGVRDIVFTSNTEGDRARPGVHALIGQPMDQADPGSWKTISISGPEGVKFDLIESIDLDGDGDMDLITCEERDNLGVFWYENPFQCGK